MTATGLTPTTVLVSARDVHAVQLDGETVLYVPHKGSLLLLNATASRIWDCLLGPVSVAQIAARLAAVFGADSRQIHADVSAVLARLLSVGAVTRDPNSEQPPSAPPSEETSEHEHA
jgi:hypothetical protein